MRTTLLAAAAALALAIPARAQATNLAEASHALAVCGGLGVALAARPAGEDPDPDMLRVATSFGLSAAEARAAWLGEQTQGPTAAVRQVALAWGDSADGRGRGCLRGADAAAPRRHDQ